LLIPSSINLKPRFGVVFFFIRDGDCVCI
jgi:hypothetical protein